MGTFEKRHIGINDSAKTEMLNKIGVLSLEQLIEQTIPASIREEVHLNLPESLSEHELLQDLEQLAKQNKLTKCYIGLGYNGTIVPAMIQRNVLENPGWYTQYTPYQAEISQGRLEALLNFQTMVSDLTGLPIANASLLDEGTAAAEAMLMCFNSANKRAKKGQEITKFFVDNNVFPQTFDVVRGRAEALDIELVVGDWNATDIDQTFFGVLLQYPNMEGCIEDYSDWVSQLKANGQFIICAADLLSLSLIKAPGDWGADVVVGNTQRFGVPMGAGGPHAAFFACTENFKRSLPGRIIGVSVDRFGNSALRMALQTREQHIKREKATSNICTAQALLAIMAGFYAVYHGPDGIKTIAKNIHKNAFYLANELSQLGFTIEHNAFFDTVAISFPDDQKAQFIEKLNRAGINLNTRFEDKITISVGEEANRKDMVQLINLFKNELNNVGNILVDNLEKFERQSLFMTHEIFNTYRSETAMMRYIKKLENKDLSLVHSMIPLGSCTMKLNAAVQLMPITWPEFANIHPFAPTENRAGYLELINRLGDYLCQTTGFQACSFNSNSGAQGEYSGLLVIKAYHADRKEAHRNIVLIPSSAHGTNPASAVMAGLEVVVVPCDEKGNIEIEALRTTAIEYKENLCALMVTYPSTHGVFEEGIKEINQIIHENGGMVYMDGANMNAQIGYTSPGALFADVCHLNLHKTFAIPHGGGGPGMGPICCNEKLAPYLPKHIFENAEDEKGIHAISAAAYGSALVLIISYAYVRLLGAEGLKNSTAYAILNANYLMENLKEDFPILYVGGEGRCAHEFIMDLRPYKPAGISAEDVSKRLIDYGFHAPTVSFPVPGTLMIEPTESEDKEELDRFITAMKNIKLEIDEVAKGTYSVEDNVLVNAPHALHELTANEWTHAYSREKAAYPVDYLYSEHKFWVGVGRLNNAHGDRNLICTCPPISDYVKN